MVELALAVDRSPIAGPLRRRVCLDVSIGPPSTLRVAARGDALIAQFSLQHSLVGLTQPLERNAKPIAARSVFEHQEE
jgi:hypothetical protein